MTQIRLKRVYEDDNKSDGFRVLVDKLWPRGMKKENLQYDLWAKEIAPSEGLRKWFHLDPDNHWEDFAKNYERELEESDAVKEFTEKISKYDTVTLLYAAKSPDHNHALILKSYLDKHLK